MKRDERRRCLFRRPLVGERLQNHTQTVNIEPLRLQQLITKVFCTLVSCRDGIFAPSPEQLLLFCIRLLLCCHRSRSCSYTPLSHHLSVFIFYAFCRSLPAPQSSARQHSPHRFSDATERRILPLVFWSTCAALHFSVVCLYCVACFRHLLGTANGIKYFPPAHPHTHTSQGRM